MKIAGNSKRKTVLWWNNVLNKRRLIRAARKHFQSSVDEERRQLLKQRYQILKIEYKSLVKQSKLASWRAYCGKDRNYPFGIPYKILAGSKKVQYSIYNIQREDDTWTNSVNETITALLNKYFPQDIKAEGTIDQAELRGKKELSSFMAEKRYQSKKDGPFMLSELESAVKSFNITRAPGLDGFPVAGISQILTLIPKEWLLILNRCLHEGIFPKVWKISLVVWIPKVGGKSVCPICLLPVLGKVLDKLCTRRLSSFLERNYLISTNQFGFQRGLQTISASKNFVSYVKAAHIEKQHCLSVTLDIQNAFNSAWHPVILKKFKRFACPGDIYHLIKSFLDDRRAISGNVEITTSRGCPQGSCLGLILWITLMEVWFEAVEPEISRTDLLHAFADDALCIIAGQSMKEIERKWPKFHMACVKWAAFKWSSILD